MHIGVGLLTLRLADVHSLKEKRQVVRSVVDRLRNQFNAAVAEVDEQDCWHTAVIGVVVLSNQAAHAEQQMARIVQALEAARIDAEIVNEHVEVIPL